MPLSPETKERIKIEAAFKADDGMAHWSPMKAHIAGAEAEAERAAGLLDAIKKTQAIQEDPKNFLMEPVNMVIEINSILSEAVNKYYSPGK